MNFCNCPNCQTENCPAAIDLASVLRELEEEKAHIEQLARYRKEGICSWCGRVFKCETCSESQVNQTRSESRAAWLLEHARNCAVRERDQLQAEVERLKGSIGLAIGCLEDTMREMPVSSDTWTRVLAVLEDHQCHFPQLLLAKLKEKGL